MTDVILFFDLVSMVPETKQYQFNLIKHILKNEIITFVDFAHLG